MDYPKDFKSRYHGTTLDAANKKVFICNWQGKFIQNRYCIYFTLESRNGRYKIFRSCTQRIDSFRLYNVLYSKSTGNQNIQIFYSVVCFYSTLHLIFIFK